MIKFQYKINIYPLLRNTNTQYIVYTFYTINLFDSHTGKVFISVVIFYSPFVVVLLPPPIPPCHPSPVIVDTLIMYYKILDTVTYNTV